MAELAVPNETPGHGGLGNDKRLQDEEGKQRERCLKRAKNTQQNQTKPAEDFKGFGLYF